MQFVAAQFTRDGCPGPELVVRRGKPRRRAILTVPDHGRTCARPDRPAPGFPQALIVLEDDRPPHPRRQTYVGADVPVLAYLQRLSETGENPRDYDRIWCYS